MPKMSIESVAMQQARILAMKTEDLPVDIKIFNCLIRNGIYTVGEITRMRDDEILRLPWVGSKTLKAIREAVTELGFKEMPLAPKEGTIKPKRFTSNKPLPTPYEDEVLKILIEEAGETIQRISKMQRFGKDEVQPGHSYTNAQRAGREAGQLWHMMCKAMDIGLLDKEEFKNGTLEKPAQLERFMQFLPEDK